MHRDGRMQRANRSTVFPCVLPPYAHFRTPARCMGVAGLARRIGVVVLKIGFLEVAFIGAALFTGARTESAEMAAANAGGAGSDTL